MAGRVKLDVASKTALFLPAVIAAPAFVVQQCTCRRFAGHQAMDSTHMSHIGLSMRDRAHAGPDTSRLRMGLLIRAASAAILSGAGGVAAQDRTNVTPFVNAATYTGDVLSNTSTIDNSTAFAFWYGTILTNAGVINNNAGATWTGDVTNAGDLNNFGIWTGDVVGNYGSNRIENRSGATWVGDILLNHDVITNFASATWRGDILGNGGDGHDYVDNLGNWFGDVFANAGTVYNTDGIWTGDIYGNTNTIVNNFVDPANGSVWVGDVLGNDWLIMNYTNGTWKGDVVNNPGDIANYGAWIGNLTNRGRFINTGVWTGDVVHTGTFFLAENRIDGHFDNRGSIQLTGDLWIASLVNSGRLELTHDAGLQTLSAGSAVFTPTSSYEINVTSLGTADSIVVSGNAALGGTVRVAAGTDGGPYASPTSYTILSAGSISGQFDDVTTDLAFFAPHLSYDATSVSLALKRNDVGFAATGAAGNQVGVGESVELLGAGNPLYDAVLWLTPEQAQNAFDQLSGEAYPSAETVSVEAATRIGSVAMKRMRQAVGEDDTDEPAFWTQFYGAGGLVAAGANTAPLSGAGGGIALGADGLLSDWRLGLMLHAGAISSATPALGSTIAGTDSGLGIYGGRAWGRARLALGAIYTRHDMHATRSVAFPGFTDALSAQYAAGTAQAFAELTHEFDLGSVSLLPYLGIAHVSHATDGFAETGGAAALSQAGNTVDATFVTLGLRAEQHFIVGDTLVLAASGSLGWRHAFADVPRATQALAGGAGFGVVGTPIASDMIVLSAGLNIDVSEAMAIDLAYDGQLSAGARTHSLHGTWTTRF